MKEFKVVMTALLFFCLTAVSPAKEVIRITNGEWPPYLSEELPYYGLASRIITEAFLTVDVKVDYGFFPWTRALFLAQNGKWDGSAVWFWNPEREADFYISDPVIESKIVFFHLKKLKFDWKEIDDLKQYHIGATQKYEYGSEFQKAEQEKRIQVNRVTSDEINLRKLLRGRIDLFPLDMEVGLNMLRKNFSLQDNERVTYHPRLVHSDSLHLLLSKKLEKNRLLILRFNEGLKKIKVSGRYEVLIQEARQWE